MDTYEKIGYSCLGVVAALYLLAVLVGMIAAFPFGLIGLVVLIGVGALVILIFMAATSHDFWLANLTAPVWKGLHMCVYLAYALLVGHVVLGAIQSSTGSGFALLTIAGSV